METTPRRTRTPPVEVTLLHDAAPPGAPPETEDAAVQARAVADALRRRGFATRMAAVSDDPDAWRRACFSPDGRPRQAVVFNLVESPGGRDRRAPRVPRWLRRHGVAYTGSSAEALAATNDKPRAKQRLLAAGLDTPPWWDAVHMDTRPFAPGRYIVKSAFEHASAGLDDTSVVDAATLEALRKAVSRRTRRTGRKHFAEWFVDGREFNIGVMEGPSGRWTLPPAEIVFDGFPPGKPRIVGYDAKWRDASFESRHTTRRMDFPPSDDGLLSTLRTEALAAWTVFGLRGYARVDFRVDGSGRAWMLEVNANPCLSPDAGFAAMLARAGVDFADAAAWIVEAARAEVPATTGKG